MKRLDINAGVMEMGERIAWGSDTSLMREAARKIESMQKRQDRLLVLATKYCPREHHDWREILRIADDT
ncbi:MAG: hypothetical protein JMN25_14645 [gamma proteobacterium endosymbiont of Lamellibrachia anaximandri]|nr:hypothetical protein [gamma proteobacterium endosymbiont of Lamellibrachia anaximandri]